MRTEPLSSKTIAISISDSSELEQLGFSTKHLEDAIIEFARHFLALGSKLAYGGDLRPGGYSEVLYEVALTYRKDDLNSIDNMGLSSFLAWPIVALTGHKQLVELCDSMKGFADLFVVLENGQKAPLAEVIAQTTTFSTEITWAPALTQMRRVMATDCDARLALGGQVSGYKGAMPGVAEELLLHIEQKKPVYILGAFGGAAREFGDFIFDGLHPKWLPKEQERITVAQLDNGLDESQNRLLHTTQFIDQAITLVLRGLLNLYPK
jgi:SLOG cluster2